MFMAQLALARHYRPRSFDEVVGQEVVLSALRNGLNLKRLHHAYLLTGTRGVGKTTIARILAACLNCEQGVSAEPCGECTTCQEINEGRFVDLIEVDAASRTKVEDTRELLDNIQYLPNRGRYKIYLIDEVHMLSNHSFNALLKTLEEPPAHVKFILATTDPQKLPATVLSRCLQFHLWRLPVKKISSYLGVILKKEQVLFEEEALIELARAADGSLRDALSLLDQAINYSDGEVKASDVRSMLGISERAGLLSVVRYLGQGDGVGVLREGRALAESAPDFSNLLAQFLELLYQIAIAQKVPEALDQNIKNRKEVINLASIVSPETIQLYYQIGLNGQRDLPFAPTPEIGFEMILLRMVAFQPVSILEKTVELQASEKSTSEKPTEVVNETNKINQNQISQAEKIKKNQMAQENQVEPKNQIDIKNNANQIKQDEKKILLTELNETTVWAKLITRLNLNGLAKLLAEHCVVTSCSIDTIHLILDDTQKILFNKRYEDRLQEGLSQYFGQKVNLKITEGKVVAETPAIQHKQKIAKTYESACQTIEVDSKIQKLIEAFDAKIEQVSVKEKDLSE